MAISDSLVAYDGHWVLEWSTPTSGELGPNLGPFEMVLMNGRFVGLEERGTIIFGTFRIDAPDKVTAVAHATLWIADPTVVMRDGSGGTSRDVQSYQVEFDVVDQTRLVANFSHGTIPFTVIMRKRTGGT